MRPKCIGPARVNRCAFTDTFQASTQLLYLRYRVAACHLGTASLAPAPSLQCTPPGLQVIST